MTDYSNIAEHVISISTILNCKNELDLQDFISEKHKYLSGNNKNKVPIDSLFVKVTLQIITLMIIRKFKRWDQK